ncbi:MAG: beta-galactosidase [Treponema sp.]|nr:beta-galactosidase [Treponema sp.]
MIYSYDKTSLLRNGKRWFPVMGEIHYSRYPHEYWRESLLKMKAGGVDVASTYVIWIHHEEIEGQYDFTGDRNLRLFVQTCKECGIKLWLRIGPWVHAEVRNGGFPDWLLQKDFEARTNDERYFVIVEKWYKKIYEQVQGFFCSESEPDNPILGVQIENEFGHCGGLYDESGEDHMKRLLKMAQDIGFLVPYYTATGWGGARTGGMIPVMGGYCDAPWDPRTTEIEPSGNYIFTYERNDHNIGSDFGLGEGITFDSSKFPYLTAELGGGLQMTYHRRTVAKAKDIGAVSLVKIGSGVNLLGYYMYHGGTNPEGKLTTLQESKSTGSLNDLPVKSYDFNAPIREYGQISDIYRELKLIFYFVRDFGSELCDLPALIPQDNPLKPDNLTDIRYAYRTDGSRGYVFVNNYVRLKNMPEHKNVAFALPSGGALPELTVHSGEYFFLPFNMTFGGVKLTSAECSPLCLLSDGTTVFYAPEFSERKSGFFQFADDEKNTSPEFLVLSRNNALNAWKTCEGRLIISENTLIQDGSSSVITGRKNCELCVYPPFEKAPEGFKQKCLKNLNLAEDLPAFNFAVYESACAESYTSCNVVVKELSADEKVKKYSLDISSAVNELREKGGDCFIKLSYEGDTARIYGLVDGKRTLIADNFFSGKEYTWEIGLKRFLNKNIDFASLELEISALTSLAQIYFEKQPDLQNGRMCNLISAATEFEWSFKL